MDALLRILRDGVRAWLREDRRAPRSVPQRSAPRSPTRHAGDASAATSYPGDYVGMPPISYSPAPGKTADPGEVVWTWVPFEEDHTRGKDRPVLLVGRDASWLLALQMTSVDHDRDAAQEARAERFWVDIGSGAWDDQGRASEVRVNRVIRVDPSAVRRISVSVSRSTFDVVVAGMRRHLS